MTTSPPDLYKVVSASPAAVGIARDYVSRALQAWGLGLAAPDAALITDELVTNAVAVSPTGSALHLALGFRSPGVVLGLWDPVDKEPEPEYRDFDLASLDALPDEAGPNALPDFGGWGLLLVESLSAETWTKRTHPHGKWLYALLNV